MTRPTPLFAATALALALALPLALPLGAETTGMMDHSGHAMQGNEAASTMAFMEANMKMHAGMEIEYTEGRHAAKRLQRRGLPNVRILGGDARIGIPKYITTSSVAAVHVYFPDPWWKRRHRERRIFNDWFVAEASRMLVNGGVLHAWTDVEEYFQVMVETVAGNIDFLPLPPPEERPATHDMDYHTSFERKKRKAGFPIYRARWERKSR